jgi:hypothetical protein
MSALTALRLWGARRWWAALAATVLTVVVIAVPTDLVDTPVFSREVPPTWWSWPALVVSAVLAGLLFATYVRDGGVPDPEDRRAGRVGGAGGLLTFFAVGCPVCNKLVLLALGSSGAMTYFEPVQPVLSVAAVVLLAWALRARLTGQLSCPVT